MIDRLVVLRTVAADGVSHSGFRWPLEVGAVVEAPEWDADYRRDCGGGLHGAAWGYGDGALLSWNSDARWMVVEVDLLAGAVGSEGKCRFRRGTIMYIGDRFSATTYLRSEGAVGAIIGGTATAGYGGTATAGYRGTATAGDRGTATAGDGGTIAVRWWDAKAQRYRLRSANIGEDGFEAGVAYRCNDNGQLVRA